MAACVGCGESVIAGSRFCSTCGRSVTYATMAPPPVRSFPALGLDGLYRPRERRAVAGVCAGFALRYGWDVAIVRLVLVLSVLFGAGVPLIAYAVAWVVMPNGQWSLPAQAGTGATSSMRM